MVGFLFGGNTGQTYEGLQRQRALAREMLRGNGRTPRNFAEGITDLSGAIAGKILDNRANEGFAKGEKEASGLFESALASLNAPAVESSYSASMFAPQNTQTPVSGAETGGNTMLRDKIAESAQALGIDPIDLATAISYETAGTFDPTKKGPTTQWGQHRGLIQFGEPQAQKYGVNWDDPIGSQLGADGAVVNYLRDTGVKEGMGLLDIYSAINAGGVGRYNRSDANNGGAPGTVRDKVEQQMAGHRAKAQAMFADYQPTSQPVQVAQAGGGTMPMPMQQAAPRPMITPDLMKAMSNPFVPAQQKQMLMQLWQNQMQQQQQANDPMRQLQMQKLQREINAPAKRETLKAADGFTYYTDTGERVLPGVQAPAPAMPSDVQEYQFARSQGYEGSFVDYQNAMRKAGATTVNVGEGSSAYRKERDKKFAEQYIQLQDGATAARSKIATLQSLKGALDQSRYTGMGAETMLSMRQAARAFGFNVDDMGPEETARALGNQLALQLRSPSNGAGMPGAMSDKDREFLVASVPNLDKTPEGNARLIDFMMRVEQRNIEVAQLAQEYENRVGQLDNGFFQELARYSEANPLFPSQTEKGTVPIDDLLKKYGGKN